MHQQIIKMEKTLKSSSLQNKRHKYWSIWDLQTTLVQLSSLSTSDVRCTAQEYSGAARDVSMSSCTADWVYHACTCKNKMYTDTLLYILVTGEYWQLVKYECHLNSINWFHNMLTHLCDNTARELCSAQPAVGDTDKSTNGYTL